MTALALNTADKIGQSLVDFYKKLDAHFKAKALQKRTRRELSRLNDRELQDIGLHRGMIGITAWEAYKIEVERQTRKHGGVL